MCPLCCFDYPHAMTVLGRIPTFESTVTNVPEAVIRLTFKLGSETIIATCYVSLLVLTP